MHHSDARPNENESKAFPAVFGHPMAFLALDRERFVAALIKMPVTDRAAVDLPVAGVGDRELAAFPFARFGGGLTMSDDGGLDEVAEFFWALASLPSRSATRASSSVARRSSRSQFGHSCFFSASSMTAKP